MDPQAKLVVGYSFVILYIYWKKSIINLIKSMFDAYILFLFSHFFKFSNLSNKI